MDPSLKNLGLPTNHAEETSAPSHSTAAGPDVSTSQVSAEKGGLPSPLLEANAGLSAHLEQLADRARTYVEAASSANTRKAYASDWKHFAAWCRRSNLAPLPPHPQTVGLYITACDSGQAERGAKPNSVSTIERRLSSLSWNYAQRGLSLDRKDRHIATVMAGNQQTFATRPAPLSVTTGSTIFSIKNGIVYNSDCVS